MHSICAAVVTLGHFSWSCKHNLMRSLFKESQPFNDHVWVFFFVKPYYNKSINND